MILMKFFLIIPMNIHYYQVKNNTYLILNLEQVISKVVLLGLQKIKSINN